MEVMDAIRTRRSVRSYLEKPVEDEKVRRILEAARLAPSAKNLQEWRFIVVRDKAVRQKLAAAAKGQAFVGQAPVVIACCAQTDNHIMTCGQLCYPIDLAIAIDHLILKATEEGLGSCWVGAFYEDQVKAVLRVPEDVRVVELVPLGYPGDKAEGERNRLAFDEIVM